MELNGFSKQESLNTNLSQMPKQKLSSSEMLLSQIKEQKESQKSEISKDELIDIVNELNNDTLINTKLKFGFHDESSTFFVSVLDAKTDEIIRKYPSDEAMSLAEKMRELSGALIDTQV